jgi:hypothetical protein
MNTSLSAAERPGLLHWVSAILIVMLLLIGFFVFTGTSVDYPDLSTVLLLHVRRRCRGGPDRDQDRKSSKAPACCPTHR